MGTDNHGGVRLQHRTQDARVFSAAREAGCSSTTARVLAGRLDANVLEQHDLCDWLAPTLAALDDPCKLPDFAQAAERIVVAIERGETIAIATDHDVDGVTSYAILWRTLTEIAGMASTRVQGYVNHRLRESYGLSDGLAARVLAGQPDVLITADQGSADGPRIARLADAGIDVIVTDHHVIPDEGPPARAHSCVSPARTDSAYPDASIAGCMVAWLLAGEVAERVGRGASAVQSLIDYVAVGTVADCVSMASVNNRAVVIAGLEQINARSRACWAVLFDRHVLRDRATATDLAFSVGPRLNARGRLDDAIDATRFLLAEDVPTADSWCASLNDTNDERKAIERELANEAIVEAARQVERHRAAMVIHLPEGHPGVHGIVASRVVEHTGRPCVCLSPRADDSDTLTGSARGIPGVHVQRALSRVAAWKPELLVSHGGHRAAGGVQLRLADRTTFRDAFEFAVRDQLGDGADDLAPTVVTDGQMGAGDFSLARVAEFEKLAPFGQGFESPLFDGEFRVREQRRMGSDGRHLRLRLDTPGMRAVTAVWFNAVEGHASPDPVRVGDQISCVYEASVNRYRGQAEVQMNLRRVRAAEATSAVA